MNINKKLARAKQWAGEKMGAESKTSVSEEFAALEVEMQLRHEGMDKLHKTTTQYIQSLSKRQLGDDKEKVLPIGRLGQIYTTHGEDFAPDSQFGNCLIALGRTNEKLARYQETFASSATGSWLSGLERTLAQMKEYRTSRSKLEQRRLAYDASLSKVQKSKGGKNADSEWRNEEELRSQKAKYEESSEDVYRRMMDIKECEEESVSDLSAFLDAQLEYYDRCREVLLRCKQSWPGAAVHDAGGRERDRRKRSNTAHSYTQRFEAEEAAQHPELPTRPAIRSTSSNVYATGTQRAPSSSRGPAPPTSYQEPAYVRSNSPPRPYISRSNTSASNTPTMAPRQAVRRDGTLVGERQPSFAVDAASLRGTLRPTTTRINTHDVFADGDESLSNSATSDAYSYDRSPGGSKRSASPATSYGGLSRQGSRQDLLGANGGQMGSGLTGNGMTGKKPPPPPPSRGKKPAPPLPVKRVVL